MTDQDYISQSCTLWAIKTSGWPATDSISPSDLDLRAEDIPDNFRLGRKYLIGDDWRVKLGRPRSKITNFMESIGKRYIVSSIWAVPNKYLEFVNDWFEKLKTEQTNVVSDFLETYETIKEERIAKYPVLSEATWPEPESIKKAFKIQTFVFEMGTAKANKADPEELIAIKKKYSVELDQSVKELTDLYVEKAHQDIIENCKTLAATILENKKRITKTTLKKPIELVRQYDDIVSMFNSGKNNEVKEEIGKLKILVSSVTAKQIRERGPISEQFTRSIREIGKNIGDLSGIGSDGQVKRTLQIDKAA
jgi:hypothetical protein